MTRLYRAWGVTALAVAAGAIGLTAQRGAAPPVTAGQTPPAVGTGAISGVVIDGSTNQPIAGAIVTINGGRGALPEPSRLATDAQGRFVFTRLPASGFSLTASKHGYANTRFGQTDPSSAPRTIQLADGQWFPDGRIVMWRPSAITGTVTDEAGEPLVGVMVRVITRVIVAGRPQLASGAAAKTDDLGHYRVAGLPGGSYVVLVPSVQAAVPSGLTLEALAGYTAENARAAEAAGRQLTLPDPSALAVEAANRLIVGAYVTPPPASAEGWVYPPVFFPNARSIADAATVDLSRAEERSGVNIRLTPVRSVRVSGMLQGAAGSTPAGMTVRLLPMGNESLGYGSEAATALVAADGTFTLLRVPAGDYTIAASRSTMEFLSEGGASSFYAAPAPPGCFGGGSGYFAIGTGPSSVRASYRTCGGDASFSARQPLTVIDRDMQGVVVPLQRAVSISGRIEYPGGAPPADSIVARIGAQVMAEPATGDALLGLPNGRSLPSDLTRFKVDGLLQGAYVLQLSSPGGGELKSIEWQGRDYTDRPFDATPGRDIEDVVITLTNDATRVRGSVRDAKGAPALAGMVIAFPTDRSLWTNTGLRPTRLRTGQITTTGTYGLALRAGEYFVTAIDQGGGTDWMDPRFLEAASLVATRITLAWGETKALDVSITPVKVGR